MVLKNDTPDAVNSSVRWGTTGTWASFRLAPGESRIHWLKNPTGNPGVAVYYDADLRPGRDRFETHAGATYGVTDVRKGWPVRFLRTNGNTTIFLAK